MKHFVLCLEIFILLKIFAPDALASVVRILPEPISDIISNISSLFCTFKSFVNLTCGKFEPWNIIIYTLCTTYLSYNIIKYLFEEEFKYKFWRIVRKLPFVKEVIEKKLKETTDVINEVVHEGTENKTYLQEIPKFSWDSKSILDEIKTYLSYGHYAWSEGYVSGVVYPGNDMKLMKLMNDVYGMTAYTNPLHPDVFPGIRMMEAEIIQMMSKLFHAPNSIGAVTSGGTESIILVCKAYRDYGKYEKGITQPNMVIPNTAHAAFDKAAQLLKIEVRHAPVDSKTTRVNVTKMKKLIDCNTIMLVGSSPPFPHGCIDPIEMIGELGHKKGIPVHSDACLGGLLLAFMNRAGFPAPEFDFSVKGITSMSVDTHKYGYAPKGTSVILYRDKIYRHYQFSVLSDWPGGIYGTPNLSGSRSGGLVATCWASLLYHGEEYYIESTKKIITVSRYIRNRLQKIEGIYVFGNPEVSVIALGSNKFDIYRLSSALTDRGWNTNLLQFPSGFHICLTMQHTVDGVAERFISHVKECVEEILKVPDKKTSGTAAIYGMAQKIPDRSMISDIVWSYLDTCLNVR